MQNLIKRLLPTQFKESLKQSRRNFILGRAIQEIASLKGAIPSDAMIARLQKGWGNEDYAADATYLKAICTAVVKTRGPILECGSGVSTLLLNLLAAPRGIAVWTLENSSEWYTLLKAKLHAHGLSQAKILLSPLKEYGSFSWYTPPLVEMPTDFRLVVCDGPPGTTPGGRYGLLPICSGSLADDVVIYLDDAHRSGETKTMERWMTEYRASIQIQPSAKGSFAEITLLR